jgi:hypothetical protein
LFDILRSVWSDSLLDHWRVRARGVYWGCEIAEGGVAGDVHDNDAYLWNHGVSRWQKSPSCERGSPITFPVTPLGGNP